MESGYDINHLAREAQTRWLKPVEVFFILKNYEEHQLTHQIPQKPTSGSLYLFNKRVLKFFRKDGHNWRRRRDQRTIAEAHERLKVGNVEALNCYYAHGEENPNFQRRSYWILDPAYEHIVLVHYRDIGDGRQNSGSTSRTSQLSSSSFSPSLNSTHQPDVSVAIGEFYEPYYNESSPSSVNISSGEGIMNHGMRQFEFRERAEEVSSSSVPDLSRALQLIEHQLSLNDEEAKEIKTYYIENEDSNDLEDVLHDYDLSVQTPDASDNFLHQKRSDYGIQQHHPLSGGEFNIWKEMLDSSNNLPDVESQAQFGGQDSPMCKILSENMMIPQEVESRHYPVYSVYSPELKAYGTNSDLYPTLFDQNHMGKSLEANEILTIAQKQKFSIREISPEWCYASDSETEKILIIGSFLCDPSDCSWACMFGDTEVPVQFIQEGVLRCHAPPHSLGKVTLCITSGNRESCSEVREFEYRDKPSVRTRIYSLETEASSEELLLLVRFVQILLADPFLEKGVPETKVNLLGKSRMAEDSWSQIIDALLIGTSTPFSTLDWIVQELLKDKLEVWLSSRLQDKNQNDCSLSKKKQGIIHLVAGLGFEWALQPILNSGVSVNFRDINGWTALHWAARFGREKMVAALIASGASAGAVTDPNSQDPIGKTPASIAATWGHRGLAGYLSEVLLTSHLTSLTLEESELSKGSAAVEAERTVNSLAGASSSANEDQVSLKDTLAAVRSAAQAAARIQYAFRAHSFRKRQQREAKASFSHNNADELSLLENAIHGLSAASKLAFRNARDCDSAALSIQKKYRGWKSRKDFLTFRKKVVKIQAHVRGYQVRKNYKVCWAVGILEKVVLRWRRRGVGLRGFRQDMESVDMGDDEDILKVFRKQKVDAAIDEAVSRVLSMVDSTEARQQYHRILEKYRQAKAELESAESDTASSSQQNFSPDHGISHMENVESYRLR